MWSYMMQVKSETILQALNVVFLGSAQQKSKSVAPKPQLRILS